MPAATDVVSQFAGVWCHWPPLPYSYVICETPDATPFVSGSPVTEARCAVARKYWPGSFIVAVGTVLSIMRPVTGVDLTCALTARSYAIVRDSYMPSGLPPVSNA